jgi:hypothetical protein
MDEVMGNHYTFIQHTVLAARKPGTFRIQIRSDNNPSAEGGGNLEFAAARLLEVVLQVFFSHHYACTGYGQYL